MGAYDVEGPRIKSASAVFGTEDARPADVSERYVCVCLCVPLSLSLFLSCTHTNKHTQTRARAQVPGVGAYDLYEMGGRDHSWSITTPQVICVHKRTHACALASVRAHAHTETHTGPVERERERERERRAMTWHKHDGR